MPAVRLAEGRVWVADHSRALLSGEVHYWRLDPSVWPSVLDRVHDLGLDVLSTYVCWDFHELAPGEFDFTGSSNSRRDLLGFLELAAEQGFWVLLRPGPYIYAEWPNSGIPERCVRWHRLHPRFVEEAKVWMSAVVTAVQGKLATRGGPIVMLQADNEADPWFDVYGSQLGLTDVPGLFQEFLHDRYVQVAELNRAWGAEYSHFDQARAVLTNGYAAFAQRHRDLLAFRHWYVTEVMRWSAAEYRHLGVDVPIAANTYIDTVVQDWRAINSVCDLSGPDIYPTSSIADRPDEHRGLLDAVRYARATAPLAFIPEFEAGIWHGWHSWIGALTATHTELNALSAMLGGVHGWNWYMLAGRDSWYQSPITELGRFRPELSAAYADVVRLFRALEPASLGKAVDTAVTFSALDRACNPTAGMDLLRGLYAADIDYEFFDLDSGHIHKPLLLHAGDLTLSDAQQARLREYVAAGGTLVCFQPSVLDGLTRAPGAVTTAAAPQRLRIAHRAPDVELSSASVFVYGDVPADAEPIVAERIAPLAPTQEGGHAHVLLPVGERLTLGYTARSGAGQVAVLGVEPDPNLLVAVHAWFGARIPSRAATGSRVQSAVFERAGERFVIVTNTAREDRDVHLELDAPARAAADLRDGRSLPVTESGIVVRVAGRNGTAIRLT